MRFINRSDAGRKLAFVLRPYSKKNIVVYGLPRGGVVVAYEIASFLQAPLDVISICKIGHPDSPEYAIGVVAQDGCTLYNEKEIASIDTKWLQRETDKKKSEAQRKYALYTNERELLPACGESVILVDDGVATGLTLQLGILELNHEFPQRIIIAVPVCPKDVADDIQARGYECVTLDESLADNGAVGAYYDDFSQVSDSEVVQLLSQNC